MVATETVLITTRTNITGGTRRGSGQVAIVGPLDGGATIAANIAKRYRRSQDAATDHGDGSAIHTAVTAALSAGAPVVFAIGVDDKSGSPFTETFGDTSSISSGTLTNLPVTSVTSVDVDGTPNTIVYTTGDPSLLTLAADEVGLNTKTGDFELGTATSGSGSGAVFIYAVHDWDTAFEVLDLKAYEYHQPAGTAFTEASFGVYDKFMAHANEANKLVATAYESGVAPADVKTLTEAFHTLNGGRLKVCAAYYTGDFPAAFMGDEATRPVHGTSKLQPAADGVSYTDSYVTSEFGGEESPDAATFHGFGANAVFQDRLGVYRYTNDRAATPLGDFERFHSTRRSIRLIQQDMEDSLVQARAGNPLAFPYTNAGLQKVKDNVLKTLSNLADEGVIDPADTVVDLPALEDISDADRLNRVVPNVDVTVRLSGQVHLFKINLNVGV